MKTTELGRTGLNVSVIGLGLEHMRGVNQPSLAKVRASHRLARTFARLYGDS